MRRTQRRSALWTALIGAIVLSVIVIPLWVTADSGQSAFTATLYSDVIRFEADGVASLRMTIYDLSENELWNSGLIMGDFVDWDRTNVWGERLANGYYLYLAQGWDVGDTLVLNKAGRVVLLPGDQVELKAAPTASAAQGEPLPWEEDGPIYGPRAWDVIGNYAISGSLGVGIDPPVYRIHAKDSSSRCVLRLDGKDIGTGSAEINFANNGSNFARILASKVYGYVGFIGKGNLKFRVSTGNGSGGSSQRFNITGGATTTKATFENCRVGIGTTSPNEQLEITGNFRLPPTTATAGIIYSGGTRFIHNYGDRNTFVGESAGNVSMTGVGNTAVGSAALKLNIWGDDNTAVGVDALRSSNTSHDNTAIGRGALYFCASGYNNTAVGVGALNATTTGNSNTAVGWVALDSLTSGASNTAVGDNALHSITTSINNTAIGDGALLALTAGSRNIALGQMAGQFLDNGSDNIFIGNDGGWSMSKYIYIGNATDHTQTYIAGISGVTVSGGAQVYIKGTNQLGTLTSSERFKENIKDVGPTSDLLYDLRPVSFRYKPEIDPVGLMQYGLIAEEVAEVAPDLVINDEDGDPYTVRYEQLVPLLLNELQELRASNEALLARLEALEQAVDSLKED